MINRNQDKVGDPKRALLIFHLDDVMIPEPGKVMSVTGNDGIHNYFGLISGGI